MSTSVIPFAIAAAAGMFLLITALGAPHAVRLERPAAERNFTGRLQARLEAAELPVGAREFLTVCALGGLAAAGLALLLGAPALGMAGLLIVPMLVWQRYEAQRDKFRQEYDESLAECAQLLREGFSATGSLADAMDHTARNGPDPAAADFREVQHAHKIGSDLEASFAPVVERRRNPFFRMVAEVLTLKSQQGGNVGEVLLGLETMVREQAALRREIAARQAQARMESTIVCLAPVGFFLALKILPWMRGYEGGFYNTLLGQLVLSLAVVFSVLAFFLARRLATRGLTLEVKEVAT